MYERWSESSEVGEGRERVSWFYVSAFQPLCVREPIWTDSIIKLLICKMFPCKSFIQSGWKAAHWGVCVICGEIRKRVVQLINWWSVAIAGAYLKQLLIDFCVRRYLNVVGLLIKLWSVIIDVLNFYDYPCRGWELGWFAIIHYHDLIIKEGFSVLAFYGLLVLAFWRNLND